MARSPVIVASPTIMPLVGLAANGLLAMGSYGIACAILRQPRGLSRLLAAAVVFWTATTIGMELLGTVGAIGMYPILVWSGLVAGIGMAAWWLRGPGPVEPWDKGESPIGWDAVISLALVLVAALLYAIPSLLAAVKVVSDGPIYHLYFAARWWKAGRLILVAAPFGENAATYFPANGDLWFTWLMATWGGDTLAKVGQAPFLLLAGAAAYGSARLLGRRTLGQSDRRLLVRHLHALAALLLRTQRRHDLRGRLPAGGLFLRPVRPGRRRYAGTCPGCSGGR